LSEWHISSDGISLVVEILLQPDESLKAEQAGAFFSSESGEKKRTGRVGPSVPSNCRNANHLTDGSAQACLQTAGMPTI
jgi:hypothetical protein